MTGPGAAPPDGSPPIRVAFVLHVMQVAGAEVLVAETIARLGDRIDPVILCLDAVGPLGEQLQGQGVPVVSFNRGQGRDWGVAVRMARELTRRKVQVIHAHQYTPFFYSALGRLLAGGGPRLIFTEHGRHYPDTVSDMRRRLNRVVFARLASEVNAVCEFSARALREHDGFSAVPVHVIENGIELERYGSVADRESARRHLGFPVDRRYVTNVARFHPVKDQRTLLQAFQTVASARPDVDLLLVGDGPLRGALEEQVRTLGIESRVRFLGVRSDVPELLSATDVFCLSSVSEAASLTLLEAMATGLPVVVSDVGGNPEIVRQGQEGLLVRRQEPVALAEALLKLLDDPASSRELGLAGLRRVRATYQLSRTVSRYFDLYQRLAGISSERAADVGSPA